MCHFLMGISAKYLKDTKDRKWCPSALFPFLFILFFKQKKLFVLFIYFWLR